MLHVSYVNNVIKYKHTHTQILYIMLCKRNSCSLQRVHYTETMTTSNPTWWCGQRRHWGSGCRLWKSPDRPRLCCEHAQTYAYTSRSGSSTPSPTTHAFQKKNQKIDYVSNIFINRMDTVIDRLFYLESTHTNMNPSNLYFAILSSSSQ